MLSGPCPKASAALPKPPPRCLIPSVPPSTPTQTRTGDTHAWSPLPTHVWLLADPPTRSHGPLSPHAARSPLPQDAFEVAAGGQHQAQTSARQGTLHLARVWSTRLGVRGGKPELMPRQPPPGEAGFPAGSLSWQSWAAPRGRQSPRLLQRVSSCLSPAPSSPASSCSSRDQGMLYSKPGAASAGSKLRDLACTGVAQSQGFWII